MIDKSVKLSIKYKNLKLQPNFDEYKITKLLCKWNWSCGISHVSLVKALFKKYKWKFKSQKPCGYWHIYINILFWIKDRILKQVSWSCLFAVVCFTLQSGFGICKPISFWIKMCSRRAHNALLLLLGRQNQTMLNLK